MLLEGLREIGPDGAWTLWGPPASERFCWAGASLAASTHAPTEWAAQRDALSIPDGDIVVWPHAVRPLKRRTSVVLLHDLIPMHWERGAIRRRMWREFLTYSCRTATTLVVYSEATRTRLAGELGITAGAIVTLPVDPARASTVRSLRADGIAQDPPFMLYVGQIRPHKNVRRALDAYLASEFCKRGGAFTIVAGGSSQPEELAGIEAVRRGSSTGEIDILPRLDDLELDRLYASATMVIQPSFEEGYGLPVVEALASGIPVCCSDVDALREAAHGRARLFDPWSVPSITDAIDATASTAGNEGVSKLHDPLRLPTPAEFAEEFVHLVDVTIRTRR